MKSVMAFNSATNSAQRLLLLWATFASLAAAAFGVLALLLFEQLRQRGAGSGPRSADLSTSSPSLPPNAYTAEGFDLLFRRHQLARAISTFEACIREYPDYAEAYHGLATAQRDAGEPALAIPNHDRAIELAPDRGDFYWEKGATCQRLKDHDAAIETFEMGLNRMDRSDTPGNLHVGLAGSYRAKGDLQKALEHNNAALELNPQSDWFYRDRGSTYQAMGDKIAAEADFARARELKMNLR